MKTALVLAGHGSHISPNTAGLVWEQVDRLRAMGVADEITAAFWKEAPWFHTVFNTLTADEITIVPLFTAQGYFTQSVIPAEMGLTGAVTQRGGRVIRYAKTLSENLYLGEVVRLRVIAAMRALNTTPQETAVAIIGHSTRRNPESRKATEAQAEQIRGMDLAAQVEAVFLDDSPEISDIYTLTSTPNLIAVPFFLAPGSHTTIDVPSELGLAEGKTRATINGRSVYYTQPVGTEGSLSDVILELAREAGAVLRRAGEISSWGCFPTAGRDELIETVTAAGELCFGQLRLTLTEVHVWGDENPSKRLASPTDLRAYVRDDPFRSLATSTDLPGGWRVVLDDPNQLHAVVETVYPGAVADWAAHRRGSFTTHTFASTIERQVGDYRGLQSLGSAKQETIVNRVCAGCVRHATWFFGDSSAQVIPCPEPCNHWLSAALEESK